MAIGLALPTLMTVRVTAAIDSIIACAIGVVILLVSTLIVTRKKDQMLRIGLLYILVIYLTYFAYGLGLTAFLAQVPIAVAEYISIAVGLLRVLARLMEIDDFFWYGKGFSLAI